MLAAGIAPFAGSGCTTTNQDAQSDVGVSAIVFMKRVTTVVDDKGVVKIDVAGEGGQVVDYKRYEPGGSVQLLSPPRADGKLVNLTANFPTADFNGIDVSFDAQQAVFSMKKDQNDHYHVYTVQLSGTYELHQLTGGNADDIRKDWLAAVIPGIQVVPSGVWAVNRAQEHGCTYCFAG